MENNKLDYIARGIIVMFVALILIVILVLWMRAEAESDSVENSDRVIEMIRKAQITEKQIVVADIKHEEIKWPKYTIRVGLWGSRKPIPTITGLTTQERAKEYLEKAWLGYTIDTWVQFGENYKIDYTLPLCIAWADSHLWKALKSTHNLGNIWNNDRGDVVHYDTLDKWIEAIFRTISQGKYMRWHTTIATLSGEGRTRMWLPWCAEEKDSTKKCYASSKWVWSTNVVNCLSVLHDEQIDEFYNFRK